MSNKFTKEERRHLLNLTEKYSDIINDKRANTNIVLIKRETWDSIAREYNKTPNCRPRLTKQLKRLWENTKARAKNMNENVEKYKHFPLKNELLSDTSIDIEGGINNDSDSDNESAIVQDEHTDDEDDDGDEQQQATTDDLLEFEQIFVHGLGGKLNKQHAPKVEQHRRNRSNVHGENDVNLKQNQSTPKKSRELDTECEELLAPVIAGRVKILENSTIHQNELHQLAIKREQLQIEILKQQLNNQKELFCKQLGRERELHELRIKNECELHTQRIRHEGELQQMKLSEYNKVTTYTMGYK